MCRISVIIPCFNASRTIEASLKSLENQTFKDFEVVIIDDGSKDESAMIIKRYEKGSDLIIKLIQQENQGVSRARNNGLNIARGQYIAFLDADDEYTPDFLEVLYKSIGDKDIVFCQYKFVKLDQDYQLDVVKCPHSPIIKKVISRNDILDIYYHKRIEHVNFVGGLYRMEIIQKFGITFPIDIKYGEDSQFFCTYIYHCENGGVYVKDMMYKYAINGDSAMHNKTYEITQNIEAYKNIVKLWKKNLNFTSHMGNLLISRAIWSVAKDFAVENKEYFARLQEEYDVKKAMEILKKAGDEFLIRISARVYCISPSVFRKILKLYSKFRSVGR